VSVRRVVAILVLAMLAVVMPSAASASVTPTPETRIGHFDFRAPALIGFVVSRTVENHRAKTIHCADLASEHSLRWKGMWRFDLGTPGNPIELYDARARMWSPKLGTFLSVDEFAFHDATTTLWGWGRQNPIRWSDPFGRNVVRLQPSPIDGLARDAFRNSNDLWEFAGDDYRAGNYATAYLHGAWSFDMAVIGFGAAIAPTVIDVLATATGEGCPTRSGGGQRLPQDVGVNPRAPAPKNLDRPIGNSPSQNAQLALTQGASEIGFLETSVETLGEWYRSWDQSIQAKRGGKVALRTVAGDFRAVLLTLLPLTSVLRRRFLFAPTDSGWTAFFDNGHQGTDADAGVSRAAREIGCRGVRMVAIPDSLGTRPTRSKKGRFGASIFALYAGHDTEWLNYVRTISAVNDGGRWTFDARGEVLPFEHCETYDGARPQDRFPHELLDEYLRALGIRAFDEDFYVPARTALLLERTGPKPDQMRELSLEEVRAEFGAT
jgi:RHS repeat-associated protein